MVDKDIEVLLITGAGASRMFGIGQQPLPLMSDWVNHLVEKLNRGGYPRITGLRQGMNGPEFEAQLGAFLRSSASLDLIEDLLVPSLELPYTPESLRSTDALAGWHQNTTSHINKILDVIRASLYEQFGEAAINMGAARDAFSSLFDALGLARTSSFVFATTNYDIIATSVLSDLEWRPEWGTAPPVRPGGGESRIDVSDLLGTLPRSTPVLHLHGKIGWYDRKGGMPTEIANTNYLEEFGTPIIMLPDPDKDYGINATINSLWDQFKHALSRARRVLILGHSLNDRFLVEALRNEVDTHGRIAVTGYVRSDAAAVEALEPVKNVVLETIPAARVIGVRFGEDIHGHDEIRTWIRNAP